MLLITFHIAVVNAKHEKYFNILNFIHKNLGWNTYIFLIKIKRSIELFIFVRHL